MEQFLQSYSTKAMRTAIYPNIGNNLSYPPKAVMDEWGEIAEKLLGKTPPFSHNDLAHELGDAYWEINALVVEMGYNFSTLILEAADMNVISESVQGLVIDGYLMISKVMGRLKKYERDGDAAQMVLARDFTVQLLAILGAIVYEAGFELQEILQMNLDKLADRQERNVLGGDGDAR